MRPVHVMVLALIVGCGGGNTAKPEPVADTVAPVVSESPKPIPAASGVSLPEVTNTIGMRLKLIPADEFLMGSLETEANRSDEEKQHRVRITKPYYLGVYEVTQAEYENVMGKNPSCFKGERLPVETVSWDEAVEFCRRLSELPEENAAGHVYRLPTEAEWEYACRAGTTTLYSNGDDPGQLVMIGNVGASSRMGDFLDWAWSMIPSLPIRVRTSPVGSFQANAFGLQDMHGNVWEWCQDGYDVEAYNARTGTTDDPFVESGMLRVLRGGSWLSNPAYVRSADRNWSTPGRRSRGLGFRLARSCGVVNRMHQSRLQYGPDTELPGIPSRYGEPGFTGPGP